MLCIWYTRGKRLLYRKWHRKEQGTTWDKDSCLATMMPMHRWKSHGVVCSLPTWVHFSVQQTLMYKTGLTDLLWDENSISSSHFLSCHVTPSPHQHLLIPTLLCLPDSGMMTSPPWLPALLKGAQRLRRAVSFPQIVVSKVQSGSPNVWESQNGPCTVVVLELHLLNKAG